MEPIKDVNGQELKLEDLLKEAAIELLLEKRKEANGLIKNFLLKAENLTLQVKSKEKELESVKNSLKVTLEKLSELKKGNWTILKDNKGQSKVDSFKE